MMQNKLKMTAAVLIFLCLLGAWFWQQCYAAKIVNKQIVVIEQGAASSYIAKQLKQLGVIDSVLMFKVLAKLTGEASSMQAGEYEFSGSISLRQVLRKLVAGDVLLHHVTIPEGLWTQQILTLLADSTNITLTQWQQALNALLKGEQEGYLLPETYTYRLPLKPKSFLLQMLHAQEALLAEINPKSIEKVRIMASIIEKETALDKERAWVSAAIHNRLRLGMPLQMDPTVIYGIFRRDGVFSGNIHRKDLKTDTPWNTYTNKGLPPTPVCNPGAASLRAAAAPADVDYLYFVADGTGGHAFAATLAEHQANVKKWLRLERKR